MSNQILNLTTYPALAGAVLRHCRETKGIAQAQAAKLLGVTQPSLSRIETGRAVMSVAQLSRACEFLRLTPSDFLAKVDHARISMENMGVKVEHDRVPKTKDVLVNVLMGAALVLLVAKILDRK